MTGILGGLLSFLTGGIAGVLNSLTENIVTLGLTIFAISLGFFAISYLHRKRKMVHQERMATLIKSLHYAGVTRDVLAKPKHDPRDHMLSGLRWLLGGAGVSGAMYGYESFQPVADASSALGAALIGIIPGAIGIAQLIFSLLCSRREKKAATATRLATPGVVRVGQRVVRYRPPYTRTVMRHSI